MRIENELLQNIERIHSTPMGINRIAKNLSLKDQNAVEWCKKKILSSGAIITRQGKNWYVKVDGCIIMVNASSYTIITAHVEKH